MASNYITISLISLGEIGFPNAPDYKLQCLIMIGFIIYNNFNSELRTVLLFLLCYIYCYFVFNVSCIELKYGFPFYSNAYSLTILCGRTRLPKTKTLNSDHVFRIKIIV